MMATKHRKLLSQYCRSHALSLRLLLLILIFGACITLLVVTSSLYYEQQKAISVLSQQVDDLSERAAYSISSSLWQFDEERIVVQLDRLLALENIVYAEVRWSEVSEKIFSKGAHHINNDEDILTKEFPLYFGDALTPHRNIGTLKVIASLKGVNDAWLKKAKKMALFQLGKTLAGAGFIFFILNWLVTRHLVTIAAFAKSLNLDNLHQPLQLNRNNHAEGDELSRVVDSINLMREQLIAEIDIQKDTERELFEEREKKIEALTENRTKSQFIAVMSHEIRTPMNGVMGMLELIDQTEVSDIQKHYIDVARSSSETLLSLLNDILDFSKIAEGKISLVEKSFNMEDLVMNISHSFSHQMAKNKVDFIIELDPNLPSCMIGDSARLRQVIENLLNNAFKFTHKGKVALCIRLIEDEGESIHIQCSVRDTGIGIHKDKLDDIFHVYKQIENDDEHIYGGTGLGLSICKSLVDLMGGKISVSSKKGSWTEFSFVVSFGRDRQKEIVSNPARQSAVSLAGYRILTIGSSVGVNEDVAEYCQSLGIYCDNAANEKIGLELLKVSRDKCKAYDFIFFSSLVDEVAINDFLATYRHINIESNVVFVVAKPADYTIAIYDSEVKFIHTPLHCHQLREIMLDSINRSEIKPNKKEKEVAGLPDFSKLNVLIVDDNPVNRIVMMRMLSQFNIRPMMVCSGGEAVEIMTDDEEDFDLIFMDCEMPVIDGFEATRRIRHYEKANNHTAVKIFAVSAHVLDEKKRMARASGMQGFIDKPIHLDAIRHALMECDADQCTVNDNQSISELIKFQGNSPLLSFSG